MLVKSKKNIRKIFSQDIGYIAAIKTFGLKFNNEEREMFSKEYLRLLQNDKIFFEEFDKLKDQA